MEKAMAGEVKETKQEEAKETKQEDGKSEEVTVPLSVLKREENKRKEAERELEKLRQAEEKRQEAELSEKELAEKRAREAEERAAAAEARAVRVERESIIRNKAVEIGFHDPSLALSLPEVAQVLEAKDADADTLTAAVLEGVKDRQFLLKETEEPKGPEATSPSTLTPLSPKPELTDEEKRKAAGMNLLSAMRRAVGQHD